jgi:hypothetical protein
LMIKAVTGKPVLGAPNHRSASRKLMRAASTRGSWADGRMTMRNRLSLIEKMVSSFMPFGVHTRFVQKLSLTYFTQLYA